MGLVSRFPCHKTEQVETGWTLDTHPDTRGVVVFACNVGISRVRGCHGGSSANPAEVFWRADAGLHPSGGAISVVQSTIVAGSFGASCGGPCPVGDGDEHAPRFRADGRRSVWGCGDAEQGGWLGGGGCRRVGRRHGGRGKGFLGGVEGTDGVGVLAGTAGREWGAGGGIEAVGEGLEDGAGAGGVHGVVLSEAGGVDKSSLAPDGGLCNINCNGLDPQVRDPFLGGQLAHQGHCLILTPRGLDPCCGRGACISCCISCLHLQRFRCNMPPMVGMHAQESVASITSIDKQSRGVLRKEDLNHTTDFA